MKSNQNSLFRRLCSSELLLQAWKSVKAKGSVGGIDGISLLEFEHDLYQNLQRLADDLKNRRWKPLPYKHIEVPKKDGDKRRLGMLSLRDKIVQQAIKILIEPRCERMFLGCSYGYRPGRSALRAVRRLIAEGNRKGITTAMRLDIDDFFDCIDHEILASRLSALLVDEDELLRLIMLSVSMGCISTSGRWKETEVGVPQGAVLSPILSNLYLHSFDQFMQSRKVAYVRYADDFIVLCESENQAQMLHIDIQNYLFNRLKLRLNPVEISDISSVGYDFLGVHVQRGKISLGETKRLELLERISHFDIDSMGLVGHSLRSWDGFCKYYSKLLSQDMLKDFDEAIVCRIKSLVAEKSHIFASQKSLRNCLATITFLSQEYNANRKHIINLLVEDYKIINGKLKADCVQEENRKIINSRRLEYRRKEVEASQLLVNKPGLFIGLTNKGVTLKEKGNVIEVIPLNNLSHIVITGKGVSMSSNLLEYCAANNIPIDLFDGNGTHIGSFLSSKSTQNALWQSQARLTAKNRNILAVAIIEGKVKNQMNLIKYYHKYHKSKYPNLEVKYESMRSSLNSFKNFISSADKSDVDLVTHLVGYEAQIAIRYWDYIREMLVDDHVLFERRQHRGATDIVNAMLNYGYSILYSRVWRALLAAGLNPYESVIHVRRDNQPTFVFDIVEIFRAQVVDRIVVSMIQKGSHLGMKQGLIDEETKKTLVKNILARLCRYEKYRGHESTLDDIILSQCREIAEYIATQSKFKSYLSTW